MSFFDDLIADPTLSGARTTITAYAQAANLAVTSWIVGGVGQQVLEVCTQVGYAAERARVRVQRGFASLDTATDPGDDDAFDPTNASLTPGPGFLSNLGRNFFSTTRTEETFATGAVTFTNAGPSARTFRPYALTFTWTLVSPPSPRPTYRNSADSSVYTNPDGSVTVPAGTSVTFPVVAEESGTGSNTPPSALTLTTTMIGCSATNGSAVLAVERESADTYRTRCRQAPARLSFAAPADAILYLSTKNLDGTPLLNASGNPVNINRASSTNDSDTGIVNAYYAQPSGPAASEDVTAANNNIQTSAYAVMDCVTFTGAAATGTALNVTGTASIKNRSGLPTQLALETLLAAAITDAFKTFPIGGVDQDVDGNGVIYKVDLQAIAAQAYSGLYNVVIQTPAPASTAILVGHVGTVSSEPDDWVVTIV